MGIFSFFSKEKKETLDKGLEKTKESFFGKLTRAVAGKSKVDDDVLDRLEEVLVTSDVGVDTTLNIIDRIEKRVARDKYVTVNELNDILRDEIASLLTENNTAGRSIYRIFTIIPGCLHPVSEKRLINLLLFISGHHTDTYLGILVDESPSHHISVKIMYDYDIAIGKRTHNRIYFIIKYP
mgnify:CR=1 FL=1